MRKIAGVYKVPYSPPGGGKFIKSIGEEYEVLKRGREYHGSFVSYLFVLTVLSGVTVLHRQKVRDNDDSSYIE